MKFACVFLLLAMAAAVSAQQETKIIIDDFEVRQDLFVISSSAITTSDPPQENESFVEQDSTGEILGGERDMSISMTEAIGPNSPLTSNIGDGEWANSVPVGGAGIIFLQYDGVDGTIGLDQNGLGGIDFTNNLGSEIFVTIRSDLPAVYTMFFYSASGGNPCSVDFDVPGNEVATDFVFEFDSDFSGACDFSNIGAVEVEADASERVDSTMTFFGVRGDIPVTQTPTPSPSPLTSSAPTPSPSSTRTPDVDVPSDCHCQCPAFTCELIFDPDDDENNAYYFDDDDDNVNAGNGSSSSSDASAMKLAFTAGLVVVLAALL